MQTEPKKYHVLLSDIGMPEQDGWSFIRQVRLLSPEAGGTIPAAALTTYSSPREINIAKQLGFQVHISGSTGLAMQVCVGQSQLCCCEPACAT